jgi:hypothetical protein
MIFLVSLVITLGLTFFELSFGHHFLIFNSTAYITLAFLVSLSFRSRNYFQIFLALIAGLLFDFASVYRFPVFTTIFLLVMLSGRVFFYRKTSYNSLSTYIIFLFISSLMIYLISLPILFDNNFLGWQNYLITTVTGVLLTILVGLIIHRVLEPYYNWLDRKTEK